MEAEIGDLDFEMEIQGRKDRGRNEGNAARVHS